MTYHTHGIVFDLDGTLTEPTDGSLPYDKLKPRRDMIAVMNRLYDEGHHIIINTARHMITCKGDAALAERLLGDITRTWLAAEGAKYHELTWGKPYALIYVDDKACTAFPGEVERRVRAARQGREQQYLRDAEALLAKHFDDDYFTHLDK